MNLDRGVEGGGGHGIDPCSRFFRLPGVPGVLAFHILHHSSVDRGLRLRDFAGGRSAAGASEGRGPAPDDTSDAHAPLILTRNPPETRKSRGIASRTLGRIAVGEQTRPDPVRRAARFDLVLPTALSPSR
jgi:hypothetical protein